MARHIFRPKSIGQAGNYFYCKNYYKSQFFASPYNVKWFPLRFSFNEIKLIAGISNERNYADDYETNLFQI